MKQFVVFGDYLLCLDSDLRPVIFLIALARLALWTRAIDLGFEVGFPLSHFVLVALMDHTYFSVISI